MKMKMVVTIMIFAFIVGCNQQGCNGNGGSLSPEEKWNFWVDRQTVRDRKVLSVTESEQWIKDNRSKISIPEELSFMEQHPIMVSPFLQKRTIITVDYNGKYRVAATGFHFPEKSILKVDDTYYGSNFFILHRQEKVTESLTYKNGVKTHLVVFEAGGIVSGTDKDGTITYTSEGGATIYLGDNNIITKIVGAVYMTKEKL